MTVTTDTLDERMELGHVIRVRADGSVTDEHGVYAPEVYSATDQIGQFVGLDTRDGGWSLMEGYTGQYGYRGPVMHASEHIGGRMAEDILATPGLYVAVVVNVLSDTEEDPEPAGWAVAYREDA
jgi:hypothetical protein